jgi:hypothetical protein
MRILDKIIYFFVPRYKLVDVIKLDTGIVCKHYYDRHKKITEIKTEKV